MTVANRGRLLRHPPSHTAAVALVLVAAAFWGATFPAAKIGLEHMDVWPFMFWTRLIGTLTMLPLAFGVPRDAWRRAARPGALLGVLIFCAYAFQTLGLAKTTSTNAGLITGMYVVITPLLAALLARRAPERRMIAALVLATVGLMLLSLDDWRFSPRSGDVLVLIATLFWAFQILAVSRSTTAGHDPVALIVLELGTASVLHAIASLGVEHSLQADAVGTILGPLAVTGILGTGVAYFFQILAQRTLSASRTAILFTAEPVFAALASWLWLGEALGGRVLLGGACIITAMVVVELGEPTPTEAGVPPL